MSARGSVTVTLNGREVRLLMTIGALAEVEEKLLLDNINDAIELVSSGNVRAAMVMFAALARAGGEALSDAEIGSFDFLEVGDALAQAIAASFPEKEGDEGEAEGAAKNP